MADNKYINKVVINDTTLLDLTEDSVTPKTLVEGATAHDKSGAAITGTVINTGKGTHLWAKHAYGDIYEETITSLGTTKPDDARSFGWENYIIGSDGYYKMLSSGGGLFVKYSYVKGDDVNKAKRIYKESKSILDSTTNYYLLTANNEPSGVGKRELLGYVSSDLSSAYPTNGEKDGYWYVKIESLDTTDATATATDIVKGKTAYVNGSKVTGTLTAPSFKTAKPEYRFTTSGGVKYYIDLTAEPSTDGIIRTSDRVTVSAIADDFGEASVSDVAKGVTFTSMHGLKLVGTRAPSLNTSDATATATDIVKGKTAYVNGSKVTGTLVVAASTNNAEAYVVDATNPTVSFASTSGPIKVYGYGYTSSSSGWGGTSTTMYAFDGDGYYRSAMYGSPSKTNCTFGVSNGKLSGLPTLNGGNLLVVRGV